MTRMPSARARRTSARCRSTPRAPASAKPSVTTSSTRAPASAQSLTTSSTIGRRTATTAMSTTPGHVGDPGVAGQPEHLVGARVDRVQGAAEAGLEQVLQDHVARRCPGCGWRR